MNNLNEINYLKPIEEHVSNIDINALPICQVEIKPSESEMKIEIFTQTS